MQPRTFLPIRNRNRFAHSGKGIFVLHNGLFSQSLKRRKIFRLFSSVHATPARRDGEFIFESGRADEQYHDKFSTSGISTAVSNRARSGKKKKLPFYSISRKKLPRAVRERARLSVYGATLERRAIGKRLLTHEHRRITLMAFLIAVGEFRS